MPTFSFTARSEDGKPSSGTLVAASAADAGKMLRAEKKYPITVRPASASELGGDATSASPFATSRGDDANLASGMVSTRSSMPKMSRADVIQFSTQLAIMVETGVLLTEALDSIASNSSKPNVQRVIQDLSRIVQSGTDLSTALSSHPRSFPRLYVALIRASEKSGMMGKLLRRANDYLRDEQDTLRRVRGALTYPGIMFAFALTTTIFLLAFVLPRFTTIYANKGAALPVPTRILMSLSDGLLGHWMAILAGVGSIAAAVYLYVRTPGGRRTWHTIQLRLPLIGGLFRKLHLSRAMRMIGTMAGAGIPLVECVGAANDLCSNVLFREMWTDVSDKIQQGRPMAESLGQSDLVPRPIAQMIHSGEKGGKLAVVMEQVAGHSEQELKETIAELTRYIEPAMIVVMGAIIGGVSLALMLPIFTISKVVAK